MYVRRREMQKDPLLKSMCGLGFELVRPDCSNQTLLLETERGREDLIGGGGTSESRVPL